MGGPEGNLRRCARWRDAQWSGKIARPAETVGWADTAPAGEAVISTATKKAKNDGATPHN
jgi:hypothetical protein